MMSSATEVESAHKYTLKHFKSMSMLYLDGCSLSLLLYASRRILNAFKPVVVAEVCGGLLAGVCEYCMCMCLSV